MSIVKLLKVATPLTAATLVVFEPPANVPLLRVKVTFELSLVTTVPEEFSTFTDTAGLMVPPAVVFEGCCWNASLVGVTSL